MDNRKVNRCICHDRTFAEIKEYSKKCEINSVNELVKRDVCGTQCGICKPYVKMMLRTGMVAFKPSDIYRF